MQAPTQRCARISRSPEVASPKPKIPGVVPPPGTSRLSVDRSVGYGTASTDTGLAAHGQCLEGRAFTIGTGSTVGDREEPDGDEGQRDRDDTRVGEGNDGFRIAEHIHPHGLAQ